MPGMDGIIWGILSWRWGRCEVCNNWNHNLKIVLSNNSKVEKWKYELLKLLFAKEEELAFQYKKPFIPKSLFRYRKFSEENISNVTNSQEWLSKPKDFNDPFDSCFNTNEDDLYNSLIESSAQSGKLGSDSKQQINFINIFKNTLGASEMFLKEFVNSRYHHDKFICCFSERIDSILMWAHYSDNHKGFCIEYDFSISSYSDKLFPAFYNNILLSEVTDSTDSSLVANAYPILFKDSDWSYEYEWRLIYHNLLIHNSNCQLLKMPKPTGIYLGIHISAENKDLIMELAQSLNVPIYKMETNYSERKLTFKKLN